MFTSISTRSSEYKIAMAHANHLYFLILSFNQSQFLEQLNFLVHYGWKLLIIFINFTWERFMTEGHWIVSILFFWSQANYNFSKCSFFDGSAFSQILDLSATIRTGHSHFMAESAFVFDFSRSKLTWYFGYDDVVTTLRNSKTLCSLCLSNRKLFFESHVRMIRDWGASSQLPSPEHMLFWFCFRKKLCSSLPIHFLVHAIWQLRAENHAENWPNGMRGVNAGHRPHVTGFCLCKHELASGVRRNCKRYGYN
jgi:hypothetical protein